LSEGRRSLLIRTLCLGALCLGGEEGTKVHKPDKRGTIKRCREKKRLFRREHCSLT